MSEDTWISEEEFFSKNTETHFARLRQKLRKQRNFREYWNDLLIEKNVTMGEVCTFLSDQVSRSYLYEFANIKSVKRNPERDIIIKMGIAIGANEDEINKLLTKAGKSTLNRYIEEDMPVLIGLREGKDKYEIYESIPKRETKQRKWTKYNKQSKQSKGT